MMRSTLLIAIIASIVAVTGAKDRAGGWNDGSRLATVESLVDRHTWIIDESVFRTARPYEPGAAPNGTLDQLFINGHFYSDKSPVPALLMAGPYWMWRTFGGPSASERPDLFCWWMTLVTSGLAYVVSTLAMHHIAKRHLSAGNQMWIAASFALATIALPYSRTVNNHILLLAVSSLLLGALDSIAVAPRQIMAVLTAGLLSGLAYTIDLGAGPIIAFGAGLLIIWRTRSVTSTLLFGAAALPWVALHHAINYAIAGTIGPANSHSEFFNWPGCPFTANSLTGSWQHPHVLHFGGYALDLMIGKRGFLGHDLTLYLAVPASIVLLRCSCSRKPEILLCCGWFLGVWLIYSATSNNYSGLCCSIRWFVPLIAPGYYILIHCLAKMPNWTSEFRTLSAISAVIAAVSWWRGPWYGYMVPGYWLLMGLAAIAWFLCVRSRIKSPTIDSMTTVHRGMVRVGVNWWRRICKSSVVG